MRGLYASTIGFSVTMIAVDHRDRNLIYVLTNQHGQAHVLRCARPRRQLAGHHRQQDGVAGGSLAVHPLTGDVFSGGPRGSYCFPPPEGYHAAHGIVPARTRLGQPLDLSPARGGRRRRRPSAVPNADANSRWNGPDQAAIPVRARSRFPACFGRAGCSPERVRGRRVDCRRGEALA